ncbi:MAG TPA: DUF5996 family protein [Methyloceanibacter sp.]|nr:DUF5996 family protein [Methyloceanibacter sp.]
MQRAPSGAPHALKQRSVSACYFAVSRQHRAPLSVAGGGRAVRQLLTGTPIGPGGPRAIRPAAAFYSNELGGFILPYDAVLTAPGPDRALMDFLVSTYEAALRWGNGTGPRSNVRPACREGRARSRL